MIILKKYYLFKKESKKYTIGGGEMNTHIITNANPSSPSSSQSQHSNSPIIPYRKRFSAIKL